MENAFKETALVGGVPAASYDRNDALLTYYAYAFGNVLCPVPTPTGQ